MNKILSIVVISITILTTSTQFVSAQGTTETSSANDSISLSEIKKEYLQLRADNNNLHGKKMYIDHKRIQSLLEMPKCSNIPWSREPRIITNKQYAIAAITNGLNEMTKKDDPGMFILAIAICLAGGILMLGFPNFGSKKQ